MNTNDPILVKSFVETTKDFYDSEPTTVLPNGWVFNKLGNTKLKRKRKHSIVVSIEKKQAEWLTFCCQTWNVKLNRESKTNMLTRLQTVPANTIEDEIKQKNGCRI